MELKSLICPSCGGSLEIEDGLDTFFCKYCGEKLVLDGQSDAAYDAKVKVKNMEHKEKMQDKRDAQERFKIESERKIDKAVLFILGGCVVLGLVGCSIFLMMGEIGVKQQEQELQATVDQIMIDIENEDFASAYVKANSLYWDDSYTSEGEEKWDAIREEIINQIEEAEKEAKGDTSNSSDEDEDKGFFDWFK